MRWTRWNYDEPEQEALLDDWLAHRRRATDPEPFNKRLARMITRWLTVEGGVLPSSVEVEGDEPLSRNIKAHFGDGAFYVKFLVGLPSGEEFAFGWEYEAIPDFQRSLDGLEDVDDFPGQLKGLESVEQMVRGCADALAQLGKAARFIKQKTEERYGWVTADEDDDKAP